MRRRKFIRNKNKVIIVKLPARKIRPFAFTRKSHQQMASMINKEFPISIENQADIIDRIYDRYPLLDKSKISIIVKAIFESIREILILGKILNVQKLFSYAKLFFFADAKFRPNITRMKVKVITPPEMRI